MAIIGYARVSTDEQHTDGQIERLKAAGAERVFADNGVSGALASRPEWDKCMDHLRKDDVLLLTKLDRVGRSLINLVETMTVLGARGVSVRCLDQGEIDTTTPTGEVFFLIMAALAQYELRIIRERTKEGVAAARTRGRVPGNPRGRDLALIKLARTQRDAGASFREIGELLKVSKDTAQRLVRDSHDMEEGREVAIRPPRRRSGAK